MKRSSSKRRHAVSAARRGQIVQRVLVDGWTTAHAAAAFGLPHRLVEIWVADYRRHGMGSLRRAPRRTVAAELVAIWLCRPIALSLRRMSNGLRRLLAPRQRTELAEPRGSRDDRRGGSS